MRVDLPSSTEPAVVKRSISWEFRSGAEVLMLEELFDWLSARRIVDWRRGLKPEVGLWA